MSEEQNNWNTRVTAYEHAQFLQSYEWGEFQRSLGREIIRTTHCLAVRLPLWRGAWYYYCPRGPLGKSDPSIEQLRDSVSGIFIRYEPTEIPSRILLQQSTKTASVQPSAEWVVDVRQGYDAIIANMHPKTRYNIRLASKKGVRVRSISHKGELRDGDIDRFIDCLRDTAGRKAFRLHEERYYRALIDFFVSEKGQGSTLAVRARLYLAHYQDRVVGGALLFFFGDTVQYLHGGSIHTYRESMAPYALHAEALKDAAGSQFRHYNFGGVVVDEREAHPWYGISRFKKGFGGEYILYPGTYDYPLQKTLYAFYRIGRRVRHMLL